MKKYYDENISRAGDGVTYTVFAVRVIRGWDLEKALTTPAEAQISHPDRRAFWQEYQQIAGDGVSYSIFQQRVSYGWAFSEALETPVRTRKSRS